MMILMSWRVQLKIGIRSPLLRFLYILFEKPPETQKAWSAALILLTFQQYGVREMEFFIAFLLVTVAAYFFAVLEHAKLDDKEVLEHLFGPQLKGSGATGLAISLLGTIVIPNFDSIVECCTVIRKSLPTLHLEDKIIEQFQKCHIDHPYAKFFGECTDLKIKLDRCFRQEKAMKRKANFEQSKKLKERLQAFRKENAADSSQ